MGSGLDETEEKILRLLGGDNSLGFNDIVESLKGEMPVSSPKVSRRLRHLVDLGRVKREVTDDWPPRSLYSLSNTTAKEAANQHPSKTGPFLDGREAKRSPPDALKWTRVVSVILAIGLGIATVTLLHERKEIEDIRSMIQTKEK
jgi:DNA-binding Lrp family transcriptional regulator